IYSKCEFFNSDENDEVSKLKEKIHVYENSRAIRFTSLIVSWLGRLKK
nr:glycosyltransferase [Vibrio anguillarum]